MTMKRILLLFLLFCGGYVHAQELDSVRIYYRQGHREVDVLFRDNRAELERFIRILREEYGANRLESVVVRSWSSPEGVNHLNEVLSDRRADSLKTYWSVYMARASHGICCAGWSPHRICSIKKRYCTSSTIHRYGCSTRRVA